MIHAILFRNGSMCINWGAVFGRKLLGHNVNIGNRIAVNSDHKRFILC